MPLLKAICLTALLAGLSTGAWNRLQRPAWNFDVVGYVAAAQDWRTDSDEAMHRETLETLVRGIPPQPLRALAEASGYRQALAARPEALATQVPFYSVKPLYVGLGMIVGATGCNLSHAFQWISVGGWFALACLLGFGLWQRCGPILATGTAAGVAFSAPFLDAATYVTPDLSGCVPLVGAVFAWLQNRPKLAVACAVIAIGFRPDSAILLCLVFGWSLVQGRSPGRAWSSLATLACIGTVLTIRATCSPHTWGSHVRHTFIERLFEPSAMDRSITFAEYVDIVQRGLSGEFTYTISGAALFGLVSLLGWTIAHRRGVPGASTILLAWAATVASFLAFPSLDDRFLLKTYVVGAAVTAWIVGAPAAQPTYDDCAPIPTPEQAA